MLKHHAKHVLWLLALGTVVAHAAEVPVSSNYPVSQQQVHERAFARTGRPHNGDHFAALDRKRYTAQRLHVKLAHLICFRKIAGFDHQIHVSLQMARHYWMVDSK